MVTTWFEASASDLRSAQSVCRVFRGEAPVLAFQRFASISTTSMFVVSAPPLGRSLIAMVTVAGCCLSTNSAEGRVCHALGHCTVKPMAVSLYVTTPISPAKSSSAMSARSCA